MLKCFVHTFATWKGADLSKHMLNSRIQETNIYMPKKFEVTWRNSKWIFSSLIEVMIKVNIVYLHKVMLSKIIRESMNSRIIFEILLSLNWNDFFSREERYVHHRNLFHDILWNGILTLKNVWNSPRSPCIKMDVWMKAVLLNSLGKSVSWEMTKQQHLWKVWGCLSNQ